MEKFMKTMEDEGHDPKEIAPIINMARILAINSDSETSDDDSKLSE